MSGRGDEVLGLFLRQRRKQAGLTQEEVARLMDVARTTYVSLEQGQRALTSTELKALADIFHCSMVELLEGGEPGEAPRPKVREFWELLIEEVRLLPATDRWQVLDFVRFLRTRRQEGA